MTLEELPYTQYATFEQWRDVGYAVKKGSKAFWIDGKSYFTEFQVAKFEPLPEIETRTADEAFNDLMHEHEIDLKKDMGDYLW